MMLKRHDKNQHRQVIENHWPSPARRASNQAHPHPPFKAAPKAARPLTPGGACPRAKSLPPAQRPCIIFRPPTVKK